MVGVAILLIGILAINQIMMLRKAHSTFEHYYAFRRCTKLLKKTSTYGQCQLASGKIIKMVQYHNKWYLDGDLPWACMGSMCFGI